MADILVIDDDPLIRDMIELVAREAGHHVRMAGTGLKGVIAMREMKPDLVLLDMNLPEMDGYAVAKELRADPTNKTIPILAVTAHDKAEDYDAAYAAGCSAFLAKPLSAERLLRALSEQLKGK